MIQKIPAAVIVMAVLVIIAAGIIVLTLTDIHKTDQPVPSGIGVKANPAAGTLVTTRTTTIQPTSAPVLSTAVITFDPIGDKKVGDQFLITGTTSIPAGTNLFWEIRPDTGTPPTGLDMNSQMGIMANNQVTKGEGTTNRVSLDVDTKDLAAGKYVCLVMKLKGDPSTVDPRTGTLAGYTYVTLR